MKRIKASVSKFAVLVLTLLLCEAVNAQTIVFISDLNGRYGSEQYSNRVGEAMQHIVSMAPDLVISTGDMVAGQQSPPLAADQLERMWAAFNQTVSVPLQQANIPFVVTVGNHDGSAYSGFEVDREQFQAQWVERMPELAMLPGSNWPWRYGLFLDDLLLIAFDGTVPGKVDADAFGFVRGTLLENRDRAKHVIVISHLPMWPFADGREREVINDPKFLGLLQEHSVDVYASGHHHLYFAGHDEQGMMHVSVGALGGNRRAFSGEANKQPFSFVVLELKAHGAEVSAYAAPDFSGPVDPASLPRKILGPLGDLVRAD